MALNKAKATLSNTVNDDGTINLNIAFADAKGLSESYTSWPSQVALPSAAFGGLAGAVIAGLHPADP